MHEPSLSAFSSGEPSSVRLEHATLGGGCFWCLDAVIRPLRGVERVVCGYAGGQLAYPSYEAVCTGSTGHAEVVQLTYRSDLIDYPSLLRIFWLTHDPTTLNRQGADVGTQYRSVVYYHDAQQEQIARSLLAELQQEAVYPAPIITELTPLPTFYPAEDYHQDYFARNPYQGYCRAVIAPKVAKMRAQFASALKHS